MMEFLQIENRTLSQQEILSHILLVVAVLHFFLINVIDKLFNFILGVGRITASKLRVISLIHDLLLILLLIAKKLGLKERWKLRNLEIFSIFWQIFFTSLGLVLCVVTFLPFLFGNAW